MPSLDEAERTVAEMRQALPDIERALAAARSALRARG